MKTATIGKRVFGALRLIVLLALAAALCGACTIVRDPPPENNENNSNGKPPPAVDVLVVSQLDPNAAELSGRFEQIVYGLTGALAEREVKVNRVALAPLYRQAEGAVPLLYGEGDEEAEFESLSDAIVYYGRDEGSESLQDSASGESENLAALGMQLDQRSIYRASSGDPSGQPYFGEPSDGFVVVVLSATERKCGLDDDVCRLDGQSPADYFTAGGEDNADWLSLAGDEDLGTDKVYHAAFATTEGGDRDSFEEQCEARTGFPSTTLDFMEHSPTGYYEDFTREVRRSGGKASYVDLCDAMAAQGIAIIEGLAADIEGML
ncbi:MAG: hypothetical protein ACOCV2_14635 [Persicimonas sp.]